MPYFSIAYLEGGVSKGRNFVIVMDYKDKPAVLKKYYYANIGICLVVSCLAAVLSAQPIITTDKTTHIFVHRVPFLQDNLSKVFCQ
jgi:hypothetical protein